MPAMPAPTSPPNRAWEELDGSPSNQVNRFHRMPPINPANTIVIASDGLIPLSNEPSEACNRRMSLVTVTATSTDRKAPTRFNTADSVTAVFGFSAPVAMDVAMAFPVSWKPLVKSNPSAVMTTSVNTRISVVMPAV